MAKKTSKRSKSAILGARPSRVDPFDQAAKYWSAEQRRGRMSSAPPRHESIVEIGRGRVLADDGSGSLHDPWSRIPDRYVKSDPDAGLPYIHPVREDFLERMKRRRKELYGEGPRSYQKPILAPIPDADYAEREQQKKRASRARFEGNRPASVDSPPQPSVASMPTAVTHKPVAPSRVGSFFRGVAERLGRSKKPKSVSDLEKDIAEVVARRK